MTCAPPMLFSPPKGTSVGFDMGFMVLERSSHVTLGFPLSNCRVRLQKEKTKPHTHLGAQSGSSWRFVIGVGLGACREGGFSPRHGF